ncbi:nicotinate phosphoribosyltransferase [Natranaeroarchaeum sulfidigenes]|uniref:Nicotinic acid phosphoribosyltransferase n=1 Tax=Natranaeroarchaeum sulfidigenes TaxID=2784880 RepID=A0A897MUL7_9EURY|nr:nicotinate phosphoribosyltransferase [Natranaeroarchaeum sulfidigenes]QSG04222.1 Nicotinic acid phosphoribosyltransferase [Natranaeroarchaeum sulfidigenes]
MSDQFGTVSAEAIIEGTATDAYFDRTERTLKHAGKNPHVVAEVTVDQFPTGQFELVTGIEDVARLLEGRDIDVDALREGRLFDGGPVMRIEGPYLEFARFETSILGFLSQASGYATNALRARRAAPDSQVLSFGARHVHPSITPLVERAGLLAGMDGISHVAAGDVLGREAGGTMPHALMLCFGTGNQEAAWLAFDEAVDEEVPRVALCDTFTDEVDETLRAAAALGENLDSVRIDTTSSRRGDFRHILKELRWELDAIGREDVDLFVSGGITPDAMWELQDVADGFGVGSYVTDADPLDFALDIVSIDGEAISKRGKLSGVKDVYRTADGGHHVGLAHRDGPEDGEPLLEPLIRDGEVVREFDLDDAAERAAADAKLVGFE